MKKHRVIPLVIVALLFIGGGGYLYSQKPTPEVPVTSQSQKGEVKFTEAQRTEILNAIPDDQLVIVSEWGDGFVKGFDLEMKQVVVSGKDITPEILGRDLGSIPYKTGPFRNEQSFHLNTLSLNNELAEALWGKVNPEDILPALTVGYSPTGNWLSFRNGGSSGDSEDRPYTYWLYNLKTKELRQLNFVPKGWYVKQEYLEKNIPTEFIQRDFQLQERGSTNVISVAGPIKEDCGQKAGQYLWSSPIGFRLPFPAGKAKYVSREGPLKKEDGCTAGSVSDPNSCSSCPRPSTASLDGYCNRPGSHRSDLPSNFKIGSTLRKMGNSDCSHECCGHRWPNIDFGDGDVSVETNDTTVACFDGDIVSAKQWGDWVFTVKSVTPNGEEFLMDYDHGQKFLVTSGHIARGQPILLEGGHTGYAEHTHIDCYQLDITNPTDPVKVFFYPLFDEYGGMTPSDGYVYTSQNGNGGTLSLSTAPELVCGVATNGTTIGGTTRTETYGLPNASGVNSTLYRGPERLYKYNHSGGILNVTLVGNSNLVLQAFKSSNTDPLSGILNPVVNSWSDNQPAGLYYILVDTKGNTRTEPGQTFTLTAKSGSSCSANVCSDTYEPNNIPFYSTTSKTFKQLSLLSDTKVIGNLRNRKGTVVVSGCVTLDDTDYYTWSCIGRGSLTVKLTNYTGSAKQITLFDGSATNQIGSTNTIEDPIIVCRNSSNGGQYWLRVTGQSGDYKITLTWNGKSTCAGTGNKSEESEEQTTNSGFFVTPESVTICGDESVTLTSSGSPETQWFIDDEDGNASLIHTGSTLTYSPASTEIVYVVDPTDETGESRQSVTIYVSNPWNMVVTSTKGGEPQIQLGEQLTLIASAGGYNLSYEWSTGQHTGSIVVSPNTTTTYTVTITDGNGCGDVEDIVVSITDDPGGGGSGNRFFKAVSTAGVSNQYNQNQSISGTLTVQWGGYVR